MALKTSYVLQN